jgi:hypothetical protein
MGFGLFPIGAAEIHLTAVLFCVSNITEVSLVGNPVINITKKQDGLSGSWEWVQVSPQEK